MLRTKIRFRLGFILGLVLLFFSHPDEVSMRFGIPFILLGGILRIWANGCIKKAEELCTWGPYAYTRNPLYLGTILIALGFCIISRNIFLALVAIISLFFTYRRTILREEKDLVKIFGRDYMLYFNNVPRLIPRFTPYKSNLPGSFGFKRFSENKEIRNVLWIILLLIVFYLKEELFFEKWRLDIRHIIFISLAVIIILIQIFFEIKKYRFKIQL